MKPMLQTPSMALTLTFGALALCNPTFANAGDDTKLSPREIVEETRPENSAHAPLFVEVVEFEQIDKLRIQTPATRTTDDGETVPIYKFVEPEEGLSLARLTLSLGTETPRKLDTAGIQLFLPPETRFDPVAMKVTGNWIEAPTEPILLQFKSQIELAFVVPSYAWEDFEMFVAGQLYPLTVNRLETPSIER